MFVGFLLCCEKVHHNIEFTHENSNLVVIHKSRLMKLNPDFYIYIYIYINIIVETKNQLFKSMLF